MWKLLRMLVTQLFLVTDAFRMGPQTVPVHNVDDISGLKGTWFRNFIFRKCF